jgi:hypothetical protein
MPILGQTDDLLSWAKNLVILSRCKDPLEREFYLRGQRPLQKTHPWASLFAVGRTKQWLRQPYLQR